MRLSWVIQTLNAITGVLRGGRQRRVSCAQGRSGREGGSGIGAVQPLAQECWEPPERGGRKWIVP